MADIINFTLPKIDGNTDTQAMKQIKNYLFQLTEQMKFYLNNIDTDNFTDEYKQKLSNMLTTSDTNATEISRTQTLINQFNNDYKNEIQDSVQKITGNKGGYIVLRDSDNDTFPDELLVMDTSDYMTAKNMWRFNKMGLMHSNGGYDGFDTNIAITMDGRINADYISAGTLKGIRIEAAQGLIGGWNIYDFGLFKTGTDTEGKRFNIGIFTRPVNELPDISEDESEVKPVTEPFYIHSVYYNDEYQFYVLNTGVLYAKNAFIQGDINATSGYIAGFTLSDNRMISTSTDGFCNGQIRGYDFNSNHNFLQIDRIDSDGNYTQPFVVNYNGTVEMTKGKIGNFTITDYGYFESDNMTLNGTEGMLFLKQLILKNNGKWVFDVHYDGTDTIIDSWATARDLVLTSGQRDVKLYPHKDIELAPLSGRIRCRKAIALDYFSSASNGDPLVYYDGELRHTSSSRNVKKHIKSVDKNIINYESLYDLPIRQFEFKDGINGSGIDGVQIGFIADEVAKIFPNAALRNKDGEPSNWTERTIIPAMLKLIQEQHTEIENLKRIVKGA